MAVCRFFLQGNCKFGDRCKNEHPVTNTSSTSRNPFAPLQNASNNRSSSNTARGASSSRDPANLPFSLSKTVLTNDLSAERPQWILSAYGPGRDAPKQLFGGHPREQSFEEMRLLHYELAAQGKLQQAEQEARVLIRNAENQMQNALSDVDGAMKYVLDGEREHPNRIDMCKAKSVASAEDQYATVGTQAAPSFGQTSKTTPAFAQPAATSSLTGLSTPAFGQLPKALTLGQGSGPTFAQASFGQPAFGQAASLNRPTTSFGQPSTLFGQNSIAAPAFGQSSVPSPFGAPQPASRAATAQPVNPFQQNKTSSQPSTFGQSSSQHQVGVFGKPSAQTTANPFARTTSEQILTATQTTTAPHNLFAQSALLNSGDGQARDVFSTSSTDTSDVQQTGAFTQNPTPMVLASPTLKGVQKATAQIQKDSQGKVRSWNGKAVSYVNEQPCYRGADGGWRRIWFPNGAPSFANSDCLPDSVYDDQTKEIYDSVKALGIFQGGVMPILPPKRQWCDWNV